jgi:hypothetical protein
MREAFKFDSRDLRGLGWAKIAELRYGGSKYKVSNEVTFKYTPPSWVSFRDPALKALMSKICEFTFDVSETGFIQAGSIDFSVSFGDKVYKIGQGGIHSHDESCFIDQDQTDIDVDSFYPAIIINNKFFPPQAMHNFPKYVGDRDDRLELKFKAGRELDSSALKLTLNATFGKMNSFGGLKSPKDFIHVTLTGQLFLLMCVELASELGLSVTSVNTDGITVLSPPDDPRIGILTMTMGKIGNFKFSIDHFKKSIKHSCNIYATLTATGKVKCKGNPFVYTPSYKEHMPWEGKSPDASIVSIAIQAWLKDGKHPMATIKECLTVEPFIRSASAQGCGIELCHGIDTSEMKAADYKTALVAAGWIPTKRGWYANGGHELKTQDAAKIAFPVIVSESYGKNVRWYHAKNRSEFFLRRNIKPFTKIDDSRGAKVCMQLPTGIPDDLDYDFYFGLVKSALDKSGVTL